MAFLSDKGVAGREPKPLHPPKMGLAALGAGVFSPEPGVDTDYVVFMTTIQVTPLGTLPPYHHLPTDSAYLRFFDLNLAISDDTNPWCT